MSVSAAIKKGNELDLIVDGITIQDIVSGNPSITSADTDGPLFIGGLEGGIFKLFELFLSKQAD